MADGSGNTHAWEDMIIFFAPHTALEEVRGRGRGGRGWILGHLLRVTTPPAFPPALAPPPTRGAQALMEGLGVEGRS